MPAPLPGGPQQDAVSGDGRYRIGDALLRQHAIPYQRSKDDPLHRRLRIFAADPSLPKLHGAIATVEVEYEPLSPGPVGALFEVDCSDPAQCETYRSANLDAPAVLLADGYSPSMSDPRFHQQMVYAVCSITYHSFRLALGRNLTWGFGCADAPTKLRLRPHYGEERNAYYSREPARGELRFGYFRADETPMDNRSLPGGYVFTCLSHDIVVHEATHALLDGLREHFMEPTNADVMGFHEGFADLVAIFQRFRHTEVVTQALRQFRGEPEKADLLINLATQFGHATGRKGPLRMAIERNASEPLQYDSSLDAHALGSILISAVFEAYAQVFRRRTERLFRLATRGTGVLPPGELPYDLLVLLADAASKLARQFLNICIRAIDYCPPAGLTFGDYLRALITADYDLVPDDPWDYRGALIDAFRRRCIYPNSAASLSEDALHWRPPRIDLPAVPGLSFSALRLSNNTEDTVNNAELLRQAHALGKFVTQPDRLQEFGLVPPDDPRLDGGQVGLPCVQSIRTAKRVGPQGQLEFDVVAEITQSRRVAPQGGEPGFEFHGGATVILGPDGNIRYSILKSVVSPGAAENLRTWLASPSACSLWSVKGDQYLRHENPFRPLHDQG
ncbi:peptidase M4 [Achromobacter deleyi]|uniref:peptidase M4 n=1 Tax=Achromobacter deleyi TaxID=1353891 RepID=UPI00149097A2|nr:peptidase M4 [Achromobacter deleyi]QVQ28541.1 hypothetical protein HLG70_09155 [Achromobacter deleyi]UIP18652.1 hypothetical protein LYZ39_16725 [Achromobacter deleyi]